MKQDTIHIFVRGGLVEDVTFDGPNPPLVKVHDYDNMDFEEDEAVKDADLAEAEEAACHPSLEIL